MIESHDLRDAVTGTAPRRLLVDGDRLISVVGGTPDAKVVAFDKKTGQEIWKALSSVDSEPGYSQPIMIEAGGRRQLERRREAR